MDRAAASRFLKIWAPSLLYAGFIYCLSASPKPIPDAFKNSFPDWFLHGVEYGLFGVLLTEAFRQSFGARKFWAVFFAALLLGCFYAAMDEWHQSFVPMRECSFRDFLADATGLLIGSAALLKVKIHSSSNDKGKSDA